jgi:flagellar hook protein FlgE
MSFYTSLSGVKAAQTQLEVVSHNLANSETAGFKRSRTNFEDVFAASATSSPQLSHGVGTRVDSITQLFTNGPIEQTGNALDLAITGEGFFATKSATSDEVMFTRNGAFSVDQNGFVKRGGDDRLQLYAVAADGTADTSATIDAKIPAENADGSKFAGITVSANGDMTVTYADGTNEVLGRVAMASFTSPTGLRQTGSSNWSPTGLSGEPSWGEPGDGRFSDLMSGAVERSNVDLTEELVGLITAQRYFQANAKAIDTASQITQTIIGIRT